MHSTNTECACAALDIGVEVNTGFCMDMPTGFVCVYGVRMTRTTASQTHIHY